MRRQRAFDFDPLHENAARLLPADASVQHHEFILAAALAAGCRAESLFARGHADACFINAGRGLVAGQRKFCMNVSLTMKEIFVGGGSASCAASLLPLPTTAPPLGVQKASTRTR